MEGRVSKGSVIGGSVIGGSVIGGVGQSYTPWGGSKAKGSVLSVTREGFNEKGQAN